MKAAVVRAFDQPPRYETFSPPPDAPGTPVDVLAAALSPRVRSGASGRHYTARGMLPLVPGLDGVGRLPDGRRVYFLAADDRLGTMAEQTRADPRLTVALPAEVSAPVVAAAMLPAISSWVALTKRVALQPGQRVLVLGATGTAGQLAVQIARLLGAGPVVAAGRNPKALERLRELGASEIVPLGKADSDAGAVAAAASEVDIVLDYLWGPVTAAVMPAICRRRQDESRPLDWVLIGSVTGDEIALSSVLLRQRNLRILGSGQGAVGTADMFSVSQDVVGALAAGRLQIGVRAVPLADVERQWTTAPPSGERLVFVP